MLVWQIKFVVLRGDRCNALAYEAERMDGYDSPNDGAQ